MLTDKEMLNIEGGKLSWGLAGAIGAFLTLLAGIVDGYLRPLKCN
ncbi:MAG: class IIb bacteriocin, lactobin A/cerein 7B family [Bacilli bacterium]|nr:class IIb bacteriocin, lactobin A/cerein 7B family [Bacilli bacterium]MDD3895703.1 class IIb bacteriocin, lactobin A/cerein 7B family [Bacilli bacterium]MDD4407719.1 class IIb bacteriocin, lactobin A/cerein 7B family [Bacilli bacterium]